MQVMHIALQAMLDARVIGNDVAAKAEGVIMAGVLSERSGGARQQKRGSDDCARQINLHVSSYRFVENRPISQPRPLLGESARRLKLSLHAPRHWRCAFMCKAQS
nr:hypothetical protein [Methylocella tundrae]